MAGLGLLPPQPGLGLRLTWFTAARTQALAIVDLVSRKWIDHLLCPEAATVQVQALFTRALDQEGLLDGIIGRAERPADPRTPDADQPVLLAVSDNGPQMTSGSTREFMALHAIATHYGRPGVPTDQALVESFFGHLKHDWPYLEQITHPRDLDRERGRPRPLQQRPPPRRYRVRHARRRARRPRSQDPPRSPTGTPASPRSPAGLPSQPQEPPQPMTTPQHGLITARIPGVINTQNPDIHWETGHAGVAPVPISSGRRDRYRLHRGGDRQLKRALHVIAITRARIDPTTRAYLDRKRAEGKTTREALRCLKRHLARSLHRLLARPEHAHVARSSETVAASQTAAARIELGAL